jgi:hypothetical protein
MRGEIATEIALCVSMRGDRDPSPASATTHAGARGRRNIVAQFNPPLRNTRQRPSIVYPMKSLQ